MTVTKNNHTIIQKPIIKDSLPKIKSLIKVLHYLLN